MSNIANADTKNEYISNRLEPYHKRLDELERRVQELEAHRDSKQKVLPPVGTAAYFRAIHEPGCHCTRCDPAGN
jgi:DNA repair exonuclease SbcCD ATPase subunit